MITELKNPAFYDAGFFALCDIFTLRSATIGRLNENVLILAGRGVLDVTTHNIIIHFVCVKRGRATVVTSAVIIACSYYTQKP